MKRLPPVVAAAILFTGCASVPMGDEARDAQLYARTKLHLVSDAEGKQGVLETTLAETK
jgi:hypothetical protein